MSKMNSPFETKRIEVPNSGLSRRQFIYTTALAAGSLALSGCVTATTGDEVAQ